MEGLKNLKNLFVDKYYRIPDYQRGYSWEKKQIIELWNDLLNLTESGEVHFMSFISYKLIRDKNEKKQFLKSETDMTGSDPIASLTDGQQRITTIIILLNELLNYFSNEKIDVVDNNSNLEIRERYLYKEISDGIYKYKFGYTVDDPSFLYFKQYILETEAKDIEANETLYTKRLKYSKKLFAKLIKDLGKQDGGVDKLREIYQCIVNRLVFIENPLEGLNENLTFEVMNNRGKRLSDLEILKNRLLYLTDNLKIDNEKIDENEKDRESIFTSIKEQLKLDIIDAYKVIYKNLGSGEEILSDDAFLKDHWILYFGKYKKKKGDMYRNDLFDGYFSMKKRFVDLDNEYNIEMYSEVADEEDDDSNTKQDDLTMSNIVINSTFIKKYIESLKIASSYWAQMHIADSDKYKIVANWKKNEHRRLCSLVRMANHNKFRPLILAAFMNKNYNEEKIEELFYCIVRYLYISFYLYKTQASNNESHIYQLANKLLNNEFTEKQSVMSIDDVIRDLNEMSNNRLIDNEYLDVENIIKAKNLDTKGFYGNWNGLHFTLFEYEQKKYLNAPDKPIITWKSFLKPGKDYISIEHIYPQTPNSEIDKEADKYWKDKFKGYSSKEKNKCLNSIGNLLLLSQRENSSLQNASFDYKKDKAYGNTNAACSYSSIEVAKYKEWNPYTIYDRGLKIISFIEKEYQVKFHDEDKAKFLLLDFIDEKEYQKYKKNSLKQ